MKLNAISTFLAKQGAVPHMTAGSAVVNLAFQAGRDCGGTGMAEEVADLSACLACDASSFMSGTSVDIYKGLLFS